MPSALESLTHAASADAPRHVLQGMVDVMSASRHEEALGLMAELRASAPE